MNYKFMCIGMIRYTTCVPNYDKKRIIINHIIGGSREMKDWSQNPKTHASACNNPFTISEDLNKGNLIIENRFFQSNEYEDVMVQSAGMNMRMLLLDINASVVCQTLFQNLSFCSIQIYFWQLLPLAYCKLISVNINM